MKVFPCDCNFHLFFYGPNNCKEDPEWYEDFTVGHFDEFQTCPVCGVTWVVNHLDDSYRRLQNLAEFLALKK